MPSASSVLKLLNTSRHVTPRQPNSHVGSLVTLMLGTIRVAISLAHLTKSRIPLIRFALLNKSVERRRRIRRLDIDSSEDPLPLFMEMSRQPMLAKPGARKRGLYKDSPATRNSKTLSWILRHGAKTEGITMRPDGYVPVSELVSPLDSSV